MTEVVLGSLRSINATGVSLCGTYIYQGNSINTSNFVDLLPPTSANPGLRKRRRQSKTRT